MSVSIALVRINIQSDLHIFNKFSMSCYPFQNPAPGLQVFQPPLPYAETDADFHLCPLPRYTSTSTTNPHMATQKHYLDKEVSISTCIQPCAKSVLTLKGLGLVDDIGFRPHIVLGVDSVPKKRVNARLLLPLLRCLVCSNVHMRYFCS